MRDVRHGTMCRKRSGLGAPVHRCTSNQPAGLTLWKRESIALIFVLATPPSPRNICHGKNSWSDVRACYENRVSSESVETSFATNSYCEYSTTLKKHFSTLEKCAIFSKYRSLIFLTFHPRKDTRKSEEKGMTLLHIMNMAYASFLPLGITGRQLHAVDCDREVL